MRFCAVTASSVYATNWPVTAKRKFIRMSKFNMLCVVRWADFADICVLPWPNFANICEYPWLCVSVADPLNLASDMTDSVDWDRKLYVCEVWWEIWIVGELINSVNALLIWLLITYKKEAWALSFENPWLHLSSQLRHIQSGRAIK